MDVLKGEDLKAAISAEPSEIAGQTLIQAVVSLTELPEVLAHQEMNQVLQLSGHGSEELTLEGLRSAMLSYLEAIHEGMAGMICESQMSEMNEGSVDAAKSKSLVILE